MSSIDPSALFDGLLDEAEDRFGPRARQLNIDVVAREHPTPESISNGPDSCTVYFAREAEGNLPRLRFQLAHEAIHVLSGAFKRRATYFEEGFAVWFSLNLREKDRAYDHQTHANLPLLFKEALKLFKKLNPTDEKLKLLRTDCPSLDMITADRLKGHFSIADNWVAKLIDRVPEEMHLRV